MAEADDVPAPHPAYPKPGPAPTRPAESRPAENRSAEAAPPGVGPALAQPPAPQPGQEATGTGDPVVDEVIALLEGLDPDDDPADLLPTLAQAHDELAQRLRAAEG